MFAKTSALVLGLLLSVPDARAQRTNDAAARRIISTWTDDGPVPPSVVTQYRSLARRDCDQGQGIDGATYRTCQAVMLVLAEADLAAAEREYEAQIDEASGYTNEVDRRAVWRYAQRRWRELRDADCIESQISAGGGNAGPTQCLVEGTRERTLQLRRR